MSYLIEFSPGILRRTGHSAVEYTFFGVSLFRTSLKLRIFQNNITFLKEKCLSVDADHPWVKLVAKWPRYEEFKSLGQFLWRILCLPCSYFMSEFSFYKKVKTCFNLRRGPLLQSMLSSEYAFFDYKSQFWYGKRHLDFDEYFVFWLFKTYSFYQINRKQDICLRLLKDN